MTATEEAVAAWVKVHDRVRPAKNEADYLSLVELLNNLTDNYNVDEEPYRSLFVLAGNHVADWEREHDPLALEVATPAEMLAHLMRERGWHQADLADLVSQSHLSNVLSGRRAIGKRLARALAERFGVRPAMFL